MIGKILWTATVVLTLAAFVYLNWYALYVYQPVESFGYDLPQAVEAPARELDCLALNMYHEARGEGGAGMMAVGMVTMNRLIDGRYGDSVCEVVYAPDQFSWTGLKGLQKPRGSTWALAKRFAYDIYHQRLSAQQDGWIDDTNGATHYYNPHKVDPAWQREGFNKLDIGNHKFMKLETK